jgi:hypothetical protein
MNTIRWTFVLFVVLTFVTACSPVAERSDCGISEREAEKYLGGKVQYRDRTTPLVNLGQSKPTDPRMKACGFEAEDGSSIVLQQNYYDSETDAETFFQFWKTFLTDMEQKGAGDYWEDEVGLVYGTGYSIHGWHTDGLHYDVIGKVGKDAFVIKSVGARSNQKFSRVLIKGFAVQVATQMAEKEKK